MYTNSYNTMINQYKTLGRDPYESLNHPYTIENTILSSKGSNSPSNNHFIKNKVPVAFNRQPDVSQLHYKNGISAEYIGKYWDFIHIIGRTYSKKDENTKIAIKSLFFSLCDILPDENFRNILTKFINFDTSVLETLIKSTEAMTFLQAYPDINLQIKNNKHNLFNYCTDDSDKLFSWTYLLHIYYNIIIGMSSFTFNQLNEKFNKTNISKNRWGNSFWFIIHHTAIFAPEMLHENWKLSYKSFISGLQWTLPCGECRQHINENLGDLEAQNMSIDSYLISNIKIFEFSVILHNSVNVMLGTPEITLREALQIYRPNFK